MSNSIFLRTDLNQMTYTLFKNLQRSSCCGSAVVNPTSIHGDSSSLPGLAQWVENLVLLWLWHRLWLRFNFQPGKFLCPGCGPKKQKKKTNKKKKKKNLPSREVNKFHNICRYILINTEELYFQENVSKLTTY